MAQSSLSEILSVVGVGAGYLSLIRLVWGDVRDWRKKPRLKIEFDSVEDLQEWDLVPDIRKQKVATVHVRNARKTPALRCVAVLRLIATPQGVRVPQKEFSLHWADTDYTAHTSVTEPVEIGFERRRLDVAFTFISAGHSHAGAWVAIPLALSAPISAGQAHLPPGEYRVQLQVECANGKGASREFIVNSPGVWTDLSMRPSR